MAKLSLCMIFKNEANYLKDALESVKAVVDEYILVDSGSTDSSEQIAKSFDNKVRYFLRPWPGDFSDQKNFAIENATGDWILFLDADERLNPLDHQKIKMAIETRDYLAYDIPIQNYTNQTIEYGFQFSDNPYGALGFIPTHLHRLFRRDKKIRYEGILHERIEPSLKTIKAKTAPLDLVIHHLGPLKEKAHGLESERYRFYENLARKKIAANPHDAQAHWELGVILQKQKRLTEATIEFKRAMDLEPSIEEFEAYFGLSLFQQGDWKALTDYQPRFRRSQIFRLVALAQTNPKAIDELDAYRPDLTQVSLFIFELSLNHKRADRLDRDRKLALEVFEKTGLVEFLEGSTLRKQGQIQNAAELLKISKQKGCALAERELSLILGP